MTTSSSPGQPQALSSAKPAPKRRLAVDRIDAHVIGQGQGETYQLLQLPLLVGRAIYYTFAHRGYPTNLQIRGRVPSRGVNPEARLP